MDTSLKVRDDRTLIARRTTIIGDIVSQEPLAVEGCVNGNIKGDSAIAITGQINGNVKAMQIQLAGRNAYVMGTIKADEEADVLEGAAVIGNVYAGGDISISGLIKGNVNSDATVKIADTAYIAGDVVARNVHIADGSKIRGKVEIKLEKDQYDEESLLAEIEKRASEQASRCLPMKDNVTDISSSGKFESNNGSGQAATN